MLPAEVRARQIVGTVEDILDLSEDVDPERDHIRGPDDALVTLVEYGDFECPYCGQAEAVVRELLSSSDDDVRYVWRHLPLNDVHTSAPAGRRGLRGGRGAGQVLGDTTTRCSPTRAIFSPQDLDRLRQADRPRPGPLPRRPPRITSETPRVAEDVASADASGVSGTPTFFVNGRRHQGAYDIDTLISVVRAARRRASLTPA